MNLLSVCLNPLLAPLIIIIMKQLRLVDDGFLNNEISRLLP